MYVVSHGDLNEQAWLEPVRVVWIVVDVVFFVFFSSRRRHTRYWRDWSSDVCSSDLFTFERDAYTGKPVPAANVSLLQTGDDRSEERRVGKECRSRWSPYH